jgi:predicted O-methyltransferase YrrM
MGHDQTLIELISKKYGHVPFMKHHQAEYLRKIILKNGCSKLCELGTCHGKGTVYMAAILQEQGYGQLTTFDRPKNLPLSPNVEELLAEFNLQSYVKVITSPEGYIWDLADIIQQGTTRFDFCYFDAGHTFAVSGLGFVLIDLLMESGGILIFDDLDFFPTDFVGIYKDLTERQLKVPQIKMICDVLVSRFNYQQLSSPNKNWAVYRKN